MFTVIPAKLMQHCSSVSHHAVSLLYISSVAPSPSQFVTLRHTPTFSFLIFLMREWKNPKQHSQPVEKSIYLFSLKGHQVFCCPLISCAFLIFTRRFFILPVHENVENAIVHLSLSQQSLTSMPSVLESEKKGLLLWTSASSDLN